MKESGLCKKVYCPHCRYGSTTGYERTVIETQKNFAPKESKPREWVSIKCVHCGLFFEVSAVIRFITKEDYDKEAM